MAFITLLERKILGYSQLRKGPNKVRVGGVLQPFNDAVKLFSKENVSPRHSNNLLYLSGPASAILLALIIFRAHPFKETLFSLGLSLLLIYTIFRINVYPTLISGWRSNRSYAMVGAMRAVAQTISYEVSLAIIFLFYAGLRKILRWLGMGGINLFFSKVYFFAPLVGVWLISCLAETNRTPFDFAEGESELVSGFNVEYGAVGFAVIFIAEYAIILFMSIFFVFVFFSDQAITLLYRLLVTSLVFFWVWARTTLPRYRYDLLIRLAWKSFLPRVLFLLVYACRILIRVWLYSIKITLGCKLRNGLT